MADLTPGSRVGKVALGVADREAQRSDINKAEIHSEKERRNGAPHDNQRYVGTANWHSVKHDRGERFGNRSEMGFNPLIRRKAHAD